MSSSSRRPGISVRSCTQQRRSGALPPAILIAADRGQHRRGIGRALVAALEADLIPAGVELLQVKTLGPARPDAGYELTRRFYAGLGFRPLEEIHGLWPQNPCLIMVKVLRRDAGALIPDLTDWAG